MLFIYLFIDSIASFDRDTKKKKLVFQDLNLKKKNMLKFFYSD